ncbi:PP0621 family protein [Variovorax sp. PCZ-1]|uniref:PP0621 family protein n=1 Tax=Variovorax sp. PCZ-1 TaxID=2835533 RepID=UPI0024BD98EF|nr:PP0621 family protein [Variovorax sp. PCZ-1]
MKYAIVFLVILLGVWLWRKNRADDRNEAGAQPKPKSATTSTAPQVMVSCALCGVHLPKSEAFSGKAKHYCSLAHRQQREP